MSTPLAPSELPTTLGALRSSGYEPLSVREEIRENLEAAPRRRACRSRPRSSATRTPCCPSSRRRCSPDTTSSCSASGARPRRGSSARWSSCSTSGCRSSRVRTCATTPSRRSRPTGIDLVAERGDETPIAWVHRSQRFAEKLASPDTSMADLIGEVDPIKVAGGLFLDDPQGPQLRTRAQVQPRHLRDQRAARPRRAHPGRPAQRPRRARRADPWPPRATRARRHGRRDRQPRGLHQSRSAHHAAEGPLRLADPHALPLRGRRPRSRSCTKRRSCPSSPVPITVPWFIDDIIARVSHVARRSHVISQSSGVSVRLSIANFETVVANALRRTLRTHDDGRRAARERPQSRWCSRPRARSSSTRWTTATPIR